ncbi:PucR family transcriptional regulator [Nakamurella sp. GG22]
MPGVAASAVSWARLVSASSVRRTGPAGPAPTCAAPPGCHRRPAAGRRAVPRRRRRPWRCRAERLGRDLSLRHVAIVGLPTVVDAQRLSHLEQRSLTAVAEVAARRRPRPLVAMYRGLLVTLWPTGDTEPAGGLFARQSGDIVRRAMRSVPDVTGATVAVSAAGHRNYPEAYRTARGALELATRSGRTDSTVTLEDLGVAGLLLQLDDADQLLEFADRTLAEIRRHDVQRGSDLLRTLRCYLDNRQSRAATARALHVHPNTVTQRLHRIESLSGVDLGKPDTIVRIQAALTLIDVAQVDRQL